MKLLFSNFKKHLSNVVTPNHLRTFIIVIAFLLTLSSLYHAFFAHRIIPGVRIGNVRVGGLSFADAKKALEEYDKNQNHQVTLNFNNRKFVIDGNSIDLVYNWDASISRAYEVGRTGNLLTDTKDKLVGLVKPLYLSAFYDYDEDQLSSVFAGVRGEVNKEPANADVILDKDKIKVTASVEGVRIIDDAMFKNVVTSFDNISFGELDLPVKHLSPKIVETDVNGLLPQIERIVLNKIDITYKTKKWTFGKMELLDLMEFEKVDSATSVSLDEPKFAAFLDNVAQEVNELPRGKVTNVNGDQVLGFEITKNGQELDAKKFTSAFKDAYLNGNSSVALVMKDIAGPATKEKYGIYALLGEGTSKFNGSPNARIHNLTLAAEKTNGVLVPPGGIYSLNKSIGEISSKTGFDAALIITGGRTVLGEGGGVCQTSTTLFRAVLNAGLPVVMRYPHAYRVYYYELDGKVGLDASIFQPSLDFQFRNDTPNYILVQSEADVPNYSLKFKLYGTPDGRTVDVSEPIITSQTPPAEPLYNDDPNLQKGVVRQLEHAAWGATVSFTRTVKRGEEVLHNDTFSSRYQPWRAVYVRGTKE